MAQVIEIEIVQCCATCVYHNGRLDDMWCCVYEGPAIVSAYWKCAKYDGVRNGKTINVDLGQCEGRPE